MMGTVGTFIGTLQLQAGATPWEQALYPAIGGVIGVVVAVVLLFLFFSGAVYVRQGMTTIITNIVANVSIENNTTVVLPYPTPVVLSEPGRGLPALSYLLVRGEQIETDVQMWYLGRIEQDLQGWLNQLQGDVWKYLPHQAPYILGDDGFEIEKEALKYAGWKVPTAYRRVVLDRRIGRLREICSQIPELHTADSQTTEAE